MIKVICLGVVLLITQLVYGHEPALSTAMIYDQNGKRLIAIKTSLTAFESEIEYYYRKNAFKTPEEFKQLVIQHFEKNCFVIMNNDTVKLIKPTVVLGHETTVFAELVNSPQKVTMCYFRNTCFKDLHNNVCELILSLKGLPQKQTLLNADNKNEVAFKLENNSWIVQEATNTGFSSSKITLFSMVSLFILGVLLIIIKKNQLISG